MEEGKNRKFLIWLSGILAAYFIWAFLDSIINKENLFNALTNKLPFKIYHLKIPDFLLLAFFIIVFILLLVFYKRFKGISGVKEKRKAEDFYFENRAYWKRQKDKEVDGPYCPVCYDKKDSAIHMLPVAESNLFMCPACNTGAKFALKIKANEEYLFILDKIASEGDKALSLGSIRSLYLTQFKNKKRSDLTIILNDLEKKYFYIKEIEYGDWGEIGYEIVEDGLDYLKENKKP